MTTKTYINKMRGVEPITNAEIQSALKRINDRIYQLNKKGLDKSDAFKQYEKLGAQLGGMKTGKTGRVTIDLGRNKAGKRLKVSQLSQEDKQKIMEVDRHGKTAGNEIKKAHNYLKEKFGDEYEPTNEEIVNASNELGQIHDFIIDNASIIYKVESEKGNIVTNNNGKLTPEQIERLFNVKNEYAEMMNAKKEKAKKEITKDINPFSNISKGKL